MHFRAAIAGSFHVVTLYGPDGGHVYDRNEAALIAEDVYGEDWQSIFDGLESLGRDDWLRLCDIDNLRDWVNQTINEMEEDGEARKKISARLAEMLKYE